MKFLTKQEHKVSYRSSLRNNASKITFENSEISIQKSEFKNQNSHIWIWYSEFTNQDSQIRIHKSEFKSKNSEIRIQKLEFRNRNSEIWFPPRTPQRPPIDLPLTSYDLPLNSYDIPWLFIFFPQNFTPRDAHCFWQWASKKLQFWERMAPLKWL